MGAMLRREGGCPNTGARECPSRFSLSYQAVILTIKEHTGDHWQKESCRACGGWTYHLWVAFVDSRFCQPAKNQAQTHDHEERWRQCGPDRRGEETVRGEQVRQLSHDSRQGRQERTGPDQDGG